MCATSLRDAGLRLSSGPFDWLLGPSLKSRVDLISNDFAGWFEPRDFEFLGNPEKFEHDSYRNRRTGYKFSHDFELGKSFEESFPAVREKYARRIDRFYDRIRASRRILLVWLENPVVNDRPSDEDVVASLRTLAEKFPGVKVEILVVDRAPDDTPGGRLVRKEGWWRVECPYRRKSTEPGKDVRPWDIDTRPIDALLSNFEANDYRSAAERLSHVNAQRKEKYSVYGAHGLVAYAASRLQVKVCKLLMNSLRRRGADIRRLFDAQLGGCK